MIRRLCLLAACAAATATPAAAQSVQDCDRIARADAIAEPWVENTATFANGAVRIALLDRIEPAGGAFHLLILSPPHDEIGARQCRTLGLADHHGFYSVDFASLTADYDPAEGLIFTVSVRTYDEPEPPRHRLRFSLNQATGAIRAELH